MPRPVDILKHWHDRAMIDAAQLAAGRRFQELHRARDAALDALRPTLGVMDFALLSCVLGDGQDFLTAGTNNDRRYVAHRLRDALKVLTNLPANSMTAKTDCNEI